jgi:hypothetical protein
MGLAVDILRSCIDGFVLVFPPRLADDRSGRPDDLVKRALRKPEFLIVDGVTGLEQALAALWGDARRWSDHDAQS